MKFICDFSRMGINFRDESNEPRSTMIDYNDATVTAPNHSVIMWSKALLADAHATVP